MQITLFRMANLQPRPSGFVVDVTTNINLPADTYVKRRYSYICYCKLIRRDVRLTAPEPSTYGLCDIRVPIPYAVAIYEHYADVL